MIQIPKHNIFSGIQKFTTIDDPGRLSGILFTKGCNFRCRYCHNSYFLLPEYPLLLNLEVVDFLKSRVGLLDTIVICGGEPTMHGQGLIEWLRFIKSYGFRVKLDTNGTNFSLVKDIILEKLIDFIAIDYKAPISKYKDVVVVGNENIYQNILKTIELVAKSGIEYDIRTTVHSSLLTKDDLLIMVDELKGAGVDNYSIQKYVDSKNVLDKDSLGYDQSSLMIMEIKDLLKKKFLKFELRNF